jgi:hypothetical protein
LWSEINARGDRRVIVDKNVSSKPGLKADLFFRI